MAASELRPGQNHSVRNLPKQKKIIRPYQKSKQHVLIYLIFVSPQILFNKGLTQQHKKFHIKDQVWSNQFTFTGLLYNIMKPALKQVEKKNATWMISVQFNSAEPSQTFPRGSFQMEQVETTVFL